jgi:hypothetical protein
MDPNEHHATIAMITTTNANTFPSTSNKDEGDLT